MSFVVWARTFDVIRLFAVVAAAGLLAACAQSSNVSHRSERGASRQAAFEQNPATLPMTTRRQASVVRRDPPFARSDAAATGVASSGMASFYTEGSRTASGEKFNTLEL